MNELVADLEKQVQAGLAAFEGGRPEEAQRLFETVLTIDGSHVIALKTMATLYLNMGHFAEAEPLALKALLFGGPQPKPLLQVAEIAIQQSRWAHARVILNRFQSTGCTDALLLKRAAELAQLVLDSSSG